MQDDAIRVVIVDDNDMLRYGLTVALGSFSELEVVGEGRNGQEAIALCRVAKPDVLLIDLIMPEMDGVTAIRHVLQEMPEIKCIALTSFDEVALIYSAIRAGAISYIVKNISLTSLLEAIQDAYAGKSTFSQEAIQALREQHVRQTGRTDNLAEHEIEILRMMAQGLEYREIADALATDIAGLLQNIAGLMDRLGAVNRAELVIIAQRDNLIPTEQ